jgi:hypothetical protein
LCSNYSTLLDWIFDLSVHYSLRLKVNHNICVPSNALGTSQGQRRSAVQRDNSSATVLGLRTDSDVCVDSPIEETC